MARAHLFRPIMDETGTLLYGALVTVRQADVSSLLDQTMFTAPIGTDALPNPFVATNGFVDIWLDNPERVNLLIQTPGHHDITVFLDAAPPAPEIVRAVAAFSITNTGTSGQLLLATDATHAAWTNPPAPPVGVPVHNHEGAGLNSVALGDSAVGSGKRSTAVGDSATATGDQASAYGQAAQAVAPQATAVGANAQAIAQGATAAGMNAQSSGAQATAVGYNSQAVGDNSAAVGGSAQATDDGAVAVGPSTLASAAGAVALGVNAQAQGINSAAIGTGAIVADAHDNSVAIGPSAATTGPNQIMVGTTVQTVVVAGGMETTGATVLAGAGKKVGFYGSAGATIQTITGSRGGNAVLASLLTYLASLGLIVNNTTA